MRSSSSDRRSTGQLRTVAQDATGLLRIRHWVKNLLVFAPLLFSSRLLEADALARVALTFAAFCLCASGLYVLNDIVDREHDRHHPRKRDRPIAAGRVAVTPAAVLAGVMLVPGFAIATLTGLAVLYALAAYVALVVSYSLVFKRFVVLDVMVLSGGFLVRVIAGGVAVDLPISRWLLLATFFLSLFLGFCKRRHEFTLADHDEHRTVLCVYSRELLDVFIVVTVTLAIITYSLYTIDATTISKTGTDALILTIPPAVFGLLRYLYIVYCENSGGDPVSAITHDRPIVAALIVWAVVVVTVLHVWGAEKLL